MHAQMTRLYLAAFELKGIRGQSALAFALNESRPRQLGIGRSVEFQPTDFF
jgi:NOL1/NOP2/fmu family ribosome biogenesis protein